VVELSSGDRLRLFRSSGVVTVQIDVVHLDDFVAGGRCIVLMISDAVALRDCLDDLLNGPRGACGGRVGAC
jgi:hypothetical protein